MTPAELKEAMKGVLLKDLRVACRARGLNPGGSRDDLAERVKEHMLTTGDFAMVDAETGKNLLAPQQAKATDANNNYATNNYARTGTQNQGNMLTERPSSRVLAAPGGASSIVLGNYDANVPPTKPAPAASPKAAPAPAPGGAYQPASFAQFGGAPQAQGNNYNRGGSQNVGNFMTGRNTSRVLAPPGGASTITFG